MTVSADASAAEVEGDAPAELAYVRYDLDPAFYQLWLDPTHTYSGALWEHSDDDLATAQLRKLDFIAREAGVTSGCRVLDVGCGWGSMLQRLQSAFAVGEAVGITPSEQQQAFASKRCAAEVHLEGWQEHRPSAPYDAIVMIGALEHFAGLERSDDERRALYREFFQRCESWLRPGKRMCFQSICCDFSRSGDLASLLSRNLWRSELPRSHELLAAADRVLHVVRLRNDAEHYVRTIHAWAANLQARRAEAVAVTDEVVVTTFERFFRMARTAFRTRQLGLLRVTLEKR